MKNVDIAMGCDRSLIRFFIHVRAWMKSTCALPNFFPKQHSVMSAANGKREEVCCGVVNVIHISIAAVDVS